VLYPALAGGAKGPSRARQRASGKCVEIFDKVKSGQHADAQSLQQRLAIASKNDRFGKTVSLA